ncbi:DUF6470 family protein [Carboxydothermus hydrogenoformans]|uniref:Uncharacterized protein n=1 Tax=Carboxydothermus hydrogenoformans (strain ATCC BAA-161 / DSM 6008 / Z-2901) TaxID=246194 RepID=Q3ADG4_CARHZ|nr:DUF6470 family protein [Carboxydothermus hydrogenoformans]ABB13954.1 hypothetical protein CHY_0973 [Carboxydothermus hydrogenoformans Z-2901]
MNNVRVLIDTTRCWADIGYLTPVEFSRAQAKKGMDAALEGIARRVDEGNLLAAFERGNTIENIVVPPLQEVELTVRMLPTVRPEINFIKSNSAFLDIYL